MGPHFMLPLSIYVLYSNVTYIYPVSCLVKIKLFQIVSKIVVGDLHGRAPLRHRQWASCAPLRHRQWASWVPVYTHHFIVIRPSSRTPTPSKINSNPEAARCGRSGQKRGQHRVSVAASAFIPLLVFSIHLYPVHTALQPPPSYL